MWLPYSIIASNKDGRDIGGGELSNPIERRFSWGVSRPATVSVRLRTDNLALRALAEENAQQRPILVRVYHGARLVTHAIQTTYERVSDMDARSMMLTFADPAGALFPSRLDNKTADYVKHTVYSRVTLSQLIIDEADAESELAIRTGVAPMRGSTDAPVTYSRAPWKPLPEVIADLKNAPDGFEWIVDPIEYTAGAIGDWHTEPLLGTDRSSDVRFEKGPETRHNVKEVREVGDLTTSANVVWHISETGPYAPNAPVVVGTDLNSITSSYRRDDMAQAQIIDQALRQALVNEHVRVRAGFRRLINLTPHLYDPAAPARVPQFGRDYFVGDRIYAYAEDEAGTWLDNVVRVWGVTVEPNKEGQEELTLDLVEEDESTGTGN